MPPTHLFGRLPMTTKTLSHRLQCLGWRSLDESRQLDGTWRVLAVSCGHAILAFANDRNQAWSVACSMAMRLTCGDPDAKD
jgi:hypothetical protein